MRQECCYLREGNTGIHRPEPCPDPTEMTSNKCRQVKTNDSHFAESEVLSPPTKNHFLLGAQKKHMYNR